MEFLEGPALDEVLAQRRLPWAEALDYTIAAARGLRAALAHGFIHRDVKPSNLVLDREAGIKILDFGLVKSLHGDAELTRNGAIIGSPLYMAPEQGRGEDVDHRADIYSLGCALYHMLTGRPPFQGPSPVGVIAMHMSDVPAKVRSLAPEVPERLQQVVERMMAKTPADRPATYDELIAALEAVGSAQRELSGFKARSVALAIDLAPVPPLAYLLGAWVTPVRGGLLHPLPPPDRPDPGQTHPQAGGHRPAAARRLSWKTSILRFLAFAWGPDRLDPAWRQRLLRAPRAARLVRAVPPDQASSCSSPCCTSAAAAVIFVAYLCGFLLAAFHPKKLALHDVLCRTEVRYKGGTEAPGRIARFLKATTRFRMSR